MAAVSLRWTICKSPKRLSQLIQLVQLFFSSKCFQKTLCYCPCIIERNVVHWVTLLRFADNPSLIANNVDTQMEVVNSFT